MGLSFRREPFWELLSVGIEYANWSQQESIKNEAPYSTGTVAITKTLFRQDPSLRGKLFNHSSRLQVLTCPCHFPAFKRNWNPLPYQKTASNPLQNLQKRIGIPYKSVLNMIGPPQPKNALSKTRGSP